jgi:hypothetical protein
MSEPEVPAKPDDEIVNPVQQLAAEAAVEADNSESEDAVLDRLLGIDEPAPQQVNRTSEPSAPANDPDFDRALKALQRDGVPADIIASLKSDPSKVKEWGLKAAKRQADVDSFGAAKGNDKKPDAAKTENPKASTQSGDGEADADPLSEFGEIFGDEAAKPLRNLAERLENSFQERARAMEIKYETRSAYDRLASMYGSKAPSLDEITNMAATIGRENPGQFESISDIVQEAFRMKAGEPRRADPRNLAKPTVGKPPARTVREVDQDDRALDILLGGGTRDDVRRVLSR